MKRTSKRSRLWVRCCAHALKVSFQIVIKDCPNATYAFTAILRSWHRGVFAQFPKPTDRLMESVTILHFRCLYANKNVGFIPFFVCMLIWHFRDLPRSLLVPKNVSRYYIKTPSTRWKELNYSPEPFN